MSTYTAALGMHAVAVVVPPPAATWSVEELAAEMHMSAQALRRKVTFWQGQGLLKEQTADVYTLVEQQQQQQRHARHNDVAMAALDDDDDAESAMASAQDLKEEEAQVRVRVALIWVWVEKTIIVYIGYM